MAVSQSILEIVIQAIDESGAALAGAESNLKEIGQQAIGTGTQLAVMGAAITAAYVGVVDSAANLQESQDSLKQAVIDAMGGATSSSAAFATQIQFLHAKIDGYKGSMASAQATLDTHTGSVEKSAASHQKAAASIQADQVNIAKYQAQLDQLLNVQKLSGDGIDDVTSKLEAQAAASVSLGFSITDSTHSLSQAFTATKNVSEAMEVNQAAMDLARAKNIDLATATNQVILAMNGQGRALAAYGIQIKDGLSGMEALQAVQGAVNGQAQAYAQTLSGQVAVAMQSLNKLFADMGSTQLPVLTHLIEVLVKIIDAIDNFTQKHQKLTEVILIAIGIVGILITTLGTLLIVFGSLLLAIGLLGAPILILIGLVAVLAATIIANWHALADDLQAIWQVMVGIVQRNWGLIVQLLLPGIGTVLVFMVDHLGQIGATWNSTFNYIRGIISQFVNWASGIFAPIMKTINSIGSVASGIMGAAKNTIGAIGSVLHVNDAVITPSGQVIQTAPDDYLFATKNPGNLSGGGGVTVQINGGMYLSENSARMIADQVAKLIGRQLKIKNYAS